MADRERLDWVTVLAAGFPEVEAARAMLEADGIPTHVPAEFTKTMDPWITGASPLGVRLQVPPSAAARAEERIAEVRRARPRVEPTPAARLATLGARVRWCFVFPLVGWAIGAVLGLVYVVRAAGASPRPHRHGTTLWLWAAQVALLVATALGGRL